MKEIKTLVDLYKLKPLLKLNGQNTDVNSMINLVVDFNFKKKYGFNVFYSDGYFINQKTYEPFN